jgi:NADH-quinone oxidoreductase subunit C
MESDALIPLLQEALPGVWFESAASVDPHPTLYISRDDVPVVMRTLREHPSLSFAFLAELTAVDYWPREPRFELVYIVVSIEYRRRIRIKVRLSEEDAHVSDVSGIWPAANWLEREVWDLFGIVFDGHPDPRRLLMPEDWEGYPLRKDYPVQVKLPARVSEPMQVTADEFRQNLERDRLTRR